MSVGDVAGLIAAIAFVLLVGLLAIPLLKLGKVLDEARRLVGSVTDETVPLINEVTTTVGLTNHQLERVDTHHRGRAAGHDERVGADVVVRSDPRQPCRQGSRVHLRGTPCDERAPPRGRREAGQESNESRKAGRTTGGWQVVDCCG